MVEYLLEVVLRCSVKNGRPKSREVCTIWKIGCLDKEKREDSLREGQVSPYNLGRLNKDGRWGLAHE